MAKPHGKMVNVKGRKMHVCTMGIGKKNIVLLPGLNCPLPSVEYAPLMRELAKKHTVSIVELFGYGHSDSADTPRTNENYTGEIREALTIAGINPPYVLMPYSASGIYAEYYASIYPSEVAGLILLDSTPTVETVAKEWTEFFEDNAELEPYYEGDEEQPLNESEIEKLTAEYLLHGYTLEELEEFEEVPNDMDTIMAQDMALLQNIIEVIKLPFPKEIPVLVFSSGYDGHDEEERAEHEQRSVDHMARFGEQAKHIIIENSTHTDIAYHKDFVKIICKEIYEFLMEE